VVPELQQLRVDLMERMDRLQDALPAHLGTDTCERTQIGTNDPSTPMTAEKARDVARAYEATATQMIALGVGVYAKSLRTQAQRWLAYSIALAQLLPKPDVE
jgi:hypothetical protein